MARFRSTTPRHGARRRRVTVPAAALVLTTLAAPAGPAAADEPPTDAVAWGRGLSGQLGDGGQVNRLTPVAVAREDLHFTKVAGGGDHSLATAANGTTWAWGYNGHFQLGHSGGNSSTPIPVNVPSGVVDVDGGAESGAALAPDGRVWTWGGNEFADLGRGSAGADQPTPQPVAGLSNVADVETGAHFALVLRKNGTVWAWGHSAAGQVGPQSTPTWVGSPVQVTGLDNVVDIAAGNGHGLALRSDGKVFAWGFGRWGQLGDGMTGNRSTPFQVPLPGGIQSIAAGGFHSLALRSDGTVLSWGLNDVGQLGINTFGGTATPVQMLANGVAEIVGGTFSSYLRLTDGRVLACGSNANGELGDGTQTMRVVPGPVQGLTRVRQIAAGSSHALAVREPPVPPPANHTIEVEPNYATLPVGGSVTVTVNVGGNTGGNPVLLGTGKNSLPSGVTATFDPPAVVPGQSSELILNAGRDVTPTAPRLITVLIFASVGNTTKSAPLDLTIE